MANTPENGLFWFPDREDHQFPGTIQYEENGSVTLVTLQRFELPYRHYFSNAGSDRSVICGRVGSDSIKLLRCSAAPDMPRRQDSQVILETTWTCADVFKGDPYDGQFPSHIVAIEIQFASPRYWLPEHPETDLVRSSHAGEMGDDYERLRTPAHWDLGTVSLAPPLSTTARAPHYRSTGHPTAEKSCVRVDFDSPQSFESATDCVLSLQVLITVATGRPAQIDALRIVEGEVHRSILSANYSGILRVLGQPFSHRRLIHFHEFDGTLGVAQWLNSLRNQTSLRNLMVTDIYHEPAFITDRTNHLLIACDVFMRHRSGDASHLLKGVLLHMIELAGDPFTTAIGDTREWAKAVNKFRNNWGVAHFQKYGESSDGDDEAAFMNHGLYLLLVLCILRDCFSDDHQYSEHLTHEVARRMVAPKLITF